jgi:hypothetical protein
MDIEELFRNRVTESQVAEVLQLIATTPNTRKKPVAGDLPGEFDFWFDGGAGRFVTGWTEYDHRGWYSRHGWCRSGSIDHDPVLERRSSQHPARKL